MTCSAFRTTAIKRPSSTTSISESTSTQSSDTQPAFSSLRQNRSILSLSWALVNPHMHVEPCTDVIVSAAARRSIMHFAYLFQIDIGGGTAGGRRSQRRALPPPSGSNIRDPVGGSSYRDLVEWIT